MSTKDFLYGFLQGFNESGGAQKLSSWAARNIAGGEYYNPESDPLFQQELERARALNTPAAREGFIQEYGQYFDTGDMDPQDYFFTPAEGSPEWIQHEILKLSKDNKELLYNLAERFLPKQYEQNEIIRDLDLALKKDALTISNINAEAQQDLVDTMLATKKQELEEKQFNLNLNRELGPIQVATAQQQLEILRTNNKYLEDEIKSKLELQDYALVQAQIQNEILKLQRIKGEQLLPLEIEQAKWNVLNSQYQALTGQEELQYLQDTYDTRVEGEGIKNAYTQALTDYQKKLAERLDMEMDQANQAGLGAILGAAAGARPTTTTTSGEEPIIKGTKIIGYTPDGRIPLYANDLGIATYANGMPYMDEKGNQYYVKEDKYASPTNGRPPYQIVPFQPDFTSGIISNIMDLQQKPGSGLLDIFANFVLPQGGTGWFSSKVKDTKVPDIVNNLFAEFTREYGREPESFIELYDAVSMIPDEVFIQIYGIDKESVMKEIQWKASEQILYQVYN